MCVHRVEQLLQLQFCVDYLRVDGPIEGLIKTCPDLLREKITGYERAIVAFRAALQVMRSFFPLLKKLNHRYKLKRSLSIFLLRLLFLSEDDLMEKHLKSEFQELLAYGTGKSTDRSKISLFPSFIRRLVLTQCSYVNKVGGKGRRACEFLRSLYESKRCWLKMSDNLEQAAMKKHKDLLSKEKPLDDVAAAWIRRATDAIIPPGTRYDPGTCVPTYHASYETSRRDGGNHGSLAPNVEYNLGNRWEGMEISFDLANSLLKRAEEEDNVVKYQAIPEPGKFRVITAGREAIYTAMRPFQKWLIKQWKNSRFSTMVATPLDKILKLKKWKREGDLYFSGDYDSATDGLSIQSTLVCIQRVLENLGLCSSFEGESFPEFTPLAYLIIRSFAGADIEYPDGSKIKQRRGQLMGHPVSFPLLCIINLSTYMRAGLERNDSEDGMLMKKVLINGDDILMLGGAQLGDRWRVAAEAVGLTVNEAKTYVSKRYALINSVFVDMDSEKVISYMPLSVSIGHNVKKGDGITEMLGMMPQIWDLACNAPKSSLWPERGCDRVCQRLLLKRIPKLLPRRKGCRDFSRLEFTPNYFISKKLGGLGLSIPSKWSWTINNQQRRVATYFALHRDETAIIERGIENPFAVSQALKKLAKIRPSRDVYEDCAIEGVEWSGPLLEEEDAGLQLDKQLAKCLQSTAWLKANRSNEGSRDGRNEVGRIVIGMFWKALQMRGLKGMKKSAMKAYKEFRRMIPLPILKKNLQLTLEEGVTHIGDNYFTPEELDTAWKEYLDLEVVKLNE